MSKKVYFAPHIQDGDSIAFPYQGFNIVARVERDDDMTPEEKCGGDNSYSAMKLNQYRRGDWWFCGVVVNVYQDGVRLTQDYRHALWGIEANFNQRSNLYLREVAENLAFEAVKEARDARRSKPDVTPPRVNLNGTSKDSLMEGYGRALEALRHAQAALAQTAPHGRDWQTLPDRGAFPRAQAQHVERLVALGKIIGELEALGEAVIDQ